MEPCIICDEVGNVTDFTTCSKCSHCRAHIGCIDYNWEEWECISCVQKAADSAEQLANPVVTEGIESDRALMISKDGLPMDLCVICGDAELTRLLLKCPMCKKLRAHVTCILKDPRYKPKMDKWRCISCEKKNNDMEVQSDSDTSGFETLGDRVNQLESMMQKVNENLSQVKQDISVLKEQAADEKLRREAGRGTMLRDERHVLVMEAVEKEVSKRRDETSTRGLKKRRYDDHRREMKERAKKK